jgi:excisionase family DNA binding protein
MDGQSDRLLTPGEVAALFRVDPKTVTRWAASGRISSIRTPGGHRRYREVEIRALLGIDDNDRPGQASEPADSIGRVRSRTIGALLGLHSPRGRAVPGPLISRVRTDPTGSAEVREEARVHTGPPRSRVHP